METRIYVKVPMEGTMDEDKTVLTVDIRGSVTRTNHLIALIEGWAKESDYIVE